MIFVSLAIFFMNGADTDGDLLVWFIQLAVYFFLSRIAASRQVEQQSRSYEPTRGVQGAAVGAPIITSIMMWVFIILRGIVRDAMGMTIFIEPFSFCGWIILDVVLALGIGGWAGLAIIKQHEGDPYDSSNF
ncbi:MAG: hypothetical protein IPG44_17305 [Anaerolineales bacterium]|nr:hypothetical protein [Anaerolineales bacterium]